MLKQFKIDQFIGLPELTGCSRVARYLRTDSEATAEIQPSLEWHSLPFPYSLADETCLQMLLHTISVLYMYSCTCTV